jgi:hypothetical protein
MKLPQERSAAWAYNPEPAIPELDGKTILDTNDAKADAYMWRSMNASEAWLAFSGELMEIEE